ncbi:MAG: hypothetical protein ACI8QC_002466 [Planctomycetota bacterium]|jgi:hypothetical protein
MLPPLHSRHLRLAALLLPLLGLFSCAGSRSEIHVAPVYSRLSMAGGDTESEALGGALVTRRDGATNKLKYWALKPLVSWKRVGEARSFSWFLPPFGTRRSSPEEKVTQLLPVFRYASQTPEKGPDTWSLLTLPGIYWAKTPNGETRRAWLPFAGVLEHFFSYDRIEFVLFPLFMRTVRNGRTSYHFLWPIFSLGTEAGGTAWRAWPLVTNNRWEGRYERWSFLWPFFSHQENDLNKPDAEKQRAWMIWPLIGKSSRESSRAWTFLWPFFGYSSDDDTGFWAWDGPWPLVMFQGGDPARAKRQRVWPLYSYYEGDGLKSRYFLWPLFNVREEEYPEYSKKTRYLFPLWHGWERTREADGLKSRWRKAWPLFRSFKDEVADEEMLAFPALNPFWRLQFVDEHYTWMWELWTQERRFDQVRERAWLGLWHREKDRDEDRSSLSGLWAQREYSRRGVPVSETSLLFGLLRWRHEPGQGRTLLAPAFPGPGWPLERTPSSLPSLDQAPPAPAVDN